MIEINKTNIIIGIALLIEFFFIYQTVKSRKEGFTSCGCGNNLCQNSLTTLYSPIYNIKECSKCNECLRMGGSRCNRCNRCIHNSASQFMASGCSCGTCGRYGCGLRGGCATKLGGSNSCGNYVLPPTIPPN